jgi:hypothetical protein
MSHPSDKFQLIPRIRSPCDALNATRDVTSKSKSCFHAAQRAALFTFLLFHFLRHRRIPASTAGRRLWRGILTFELNSMSLCIQIYTFVYEAQIRHSNRAIEGGECRCWVKGRVLSKVGKRTMDGDTATGRYSLTPRTF